MNASCSIPQDRPLGLLNEAGQWIALDETVGVQMLALVLANNARITTSAPGVIALFAKNH